MPTQTTESSRNHHPGRNSHLQMDELELQRVGGCPGRCCAGDHRDDGRAGTREGIVIVDRQFLLTMKRSYMQLAEGAESPLVRRAFKALAVDIDRMLAA